jgi:photosystem II stability/assembly factor-like uncharacterized protein
MYRTFTSEKMLAGAIYLAGSLLLSSCGQTEATSVKAGPIEETPAQVNLDPNISTWVPVALHDQDETVSAFVLTKDNTLIAGTSAGPFMSSDNGQNWKKISLSEEMRSAVFSLAVGEGGEVYAGLSKYGVLTSSDNGNTWELQNEGLKQGGPRSSYAMLSAGNHVLKGTFESGVYLSDDHGKTWQPSNNGIPLDLNTSRMVSVTQLVQNKNTVFALTDLGVRYSTDQGKTWHKPAHNGIERVGYMLSLATKGDTLYAGVGTAGKGVYYSVDKGENWVKAGLEEEEPYVLHVNANGHLFAGTKNGKVLRSTDGGKSWVLFNKGFPANEGVYALFTTPDGKLLAGLNRKGIYLLQ